MNARDLIAATLLAASSFMACGAGPVPGLQRFYSYQPLLASSEQPKAAQIPAIAAAGYEVVINVAAPQSNPDALRNEKQLVEGAGMEYHHVPISWEKPDVKQVVEVVNLLEKHKGRAVLVHCYVNSRASLVAYLHRSLRAGHAEPEEKALMVRLWKMNPGYEYETSAQWQLLVEDAKEILGKR